MIAQTTTLLCLLTLLSAPARAEDPYVFARDVAARHGLDPEQIGAWLADAKFRPDIIEKMQRPAEKRITWYQYRDLFVQPERIQLGVEFWRTHQALLDRATEHYGVEPEIIIGIIGVESKYGRITGNYRVLDALTTLAFHYPPRAEFFRQELEHFLVLSQEEDIDALKVTGSYAGAMGLAQFMPSSYRHYAVDLDGDRRRDLWQSNADIIGSIANYLKEHGWRRHGPVVAPATAADSARRLENLDLKPAYPTKQLAEWGYSPKGEALTGTGLATLVELEGRSGPEYWFGFENFYVITRYNRSPLYAMAVYDLGMAVKAAMESRVAESH